MFKVIITVTRPLNTVPFFEDLASVKPMYDTIDANRAKEPGFVGEERVITPDGLVSTHIVTWNSKAQADAYFAAADKPGTTLTKLIGMRTQYNVNHGISRERAVEGV